MVVICWSRFDKWLVSRYNRVRDLPGFAIKLSAQSNQGHDGDNTKERTLRDIGTRPGTYHRGLCSEISQVTHTFVT